MGLPVNDGGEWGLEVRYLVVGWLSMLVCVVVFVEDDAYEVSYAACRLSLTIVELRKRVADRLKIPCSVVRILQHGCYTVLSLSIVCLTSGFSRPCWPILNRNACGRRPGVVVYLDCFHWIFHKFLQNVYGTVCSACVNFFNFFMILWAKLSQDLLDDFHHIFTMVGKFPIWN